MEPVPAALSEKRLIDSNVLVYAYAERSALREGALDVMETEITLGRGVLSTQNLAEYSNLARHKYPRELTNAQACQVVAELAEVLDVVSFSPQTIQSALSLSEQYGVHFFDALIAATMREHGISTIVTEDEGDFKKIPGITVINPFAKRKTARPSARPKT